MYIYINKGLRVSKKRSRKRRVEAVAFFTFGTGRGIRPGLVRYELKRSARGNATKKTQTAKESSSNVHVCMREVEC